MWKYLFPNIIDALFNSILEQQNLFQYQCKASSILTDLNLAKKKQKKTREYLCHSARGKSYEPGIVAVARHSHPLSSIYV